MTISRKLWGALITGGLACLVAVPYLLRTDDGLREQRRQLIESMTQVERNRLERNARLFQELSPEEQVQMRELHRQLEEDRTKTHGRHVAVLQTYSSWLQTISPHQRDQLLQEADPLRRVALVRTIVEQQRDERLESQLEGGRFALLQQRLGPLPLLSEQDFSAVLQQVQRRVQLGLTPQMRTELTGFEGVRAALKLMELLSQSGKSLVDLVDAATLKQMEDAITDPKVREQLKTIPEETLSRPVTERATEGSLPREAPSRPQLRKMKVLLTIAKNVERWLENERPQLAPDDASLQTFFKTLPEQEQEELLALAPDEFHTQLRRRFIEDELRGYNIDVRKVRRFLMPGDAARLRPLPGDGERRPLDRFRGPSQEERPAANGTSLPSTPS